MELGPVDIRVDRTRYYSRYYFYYGRYRDPFYIGINDSWAPEVYSATSYSRKFQMNLVRMNEDRSRIFEGKVQSIGSQDRLVEIMPYMITAMFSNFPGESGVTKVVTIEMDE